MKPFRWSSEKNRQLKIERGVSFEQMVVAMDDGGLLDILEHPNAAKYPKQKVLVVGSDGYASLVPCVEASDHVFLTTVIPSRKATRDYSRGKDHDAQD